jgi:2-polyprenyl-3-methyl-5-hydroxy-6-metoxy-1,4-benzoquinol methylase
MSATHEGLFDRYYSTALSVTNEAPSDRLIRNYDRNYSDVLPANRDARILDLGCGMGHLLYYLSRKGYELASGIDVSPELAEYAARAGLRVEHSEDPVEVLRSRPGQYDLIFMKDVIEHLPRDVVVPTVRAILDALKPGGRAVIETENGVTPSGIYVFAKDFTHQTLFTEESLAQAIRIAGFQRVEVRGRVLGTGPLGRIWERARRVALWPYRGLLFVDRAGAVPRIWDRNLMAIATKESSE